jgi:isochorismate synthase
MHVRLHAARTSRPINRLRRPAADTRRPERTVAPGWSSGAALRARLERDIDHVFRVHGPSKRTLCMSLQIAPVPAERLLTLPGYEHRVLWAPTPADEHSGVGAAHILTGTGEPRFAQIRDAAARAFQELATVELAGHPAPEPQMFGGCAFQPAGVDSALWHGFGDALFVLPRIAYTRRAERAWLTLTASTRELSTVAGRSRLAREADQAVRALRREVSDAPQAPGDRMLIDPAAGDWSALVAGIRGEIASGRLEKAVAARCTVVRGQGLPSAALVLERLRTEAPDCTRFALSLGHRTFLGASPERIAKLCGMRVWTEAVAGSVPGRDPAHGESRRFSPKDHVEHAIVVREIRAALAPLYETLGTDGPELHRLRHVAHLRTRFEGILKRPMHVLDLVARLHPTPAVGGAPQAAALAWIAAHEGIERGLYAGPFGAFDRGGDGEFVVAIRSGLLAADEAHLFAGAGIIEGSETSSELRETRWKLRGLLSAIGIA